MPDTTYQPDYDPFAERIPARACPRCKIAAIASGNPTACIIGRIIRERISDDSVVLQCDYCSWSHHCARGLAAGRVTTDPNWTPPEVQAPPAEAEPPTEVKAPPSPPKPQAAPRPVVPDVITQPTSNRSDDLMNYDDLARGDKMRYTHCKKVKPDLTVAQWADNGMPRSSYYKQPRSKKPAGHAKRDKVTRDVTPPQTAVEPASKPRDQQIAEQSAGKLIVGQAASFRDPITDLVLPLVESAQKRGGRCRVVFLEIDLTPGS